MRVPRWCIVLALSGATAWSPIPTTKSNSNEPTVCFKLNEQCSSQLSANEDERCCTGLACTNCHGERDTSACYCEAAPSPQCIPEDQVCDMGVTKGKIGIEPPRCCSNMTCTRCFGEAETHVCQCEVPS